jgi:predicted DNA binding CopG/RHH family protein
MQTKKRKTSASKTQKKTTRVTVDFPVAQHRKLKSLAALEGVTLQEYIRSRVVIAHKDVDISDAELNPIVEKIVEENKDALQRLASK